MQGVHDAAGGIAYRPGQGRFDPRGDVIGPRNLPADGGGQNGRELQAIVQGSGQAGNRGVHIIGGQEQPAGLRVLAFDIARDMPL
jgi:hypothetical protein